MRHCSLLFLMLLFCGSLLGQTQTKDLSAYAPTKDYPNIYTSTLHDDENTTMFLIFIKQGVRQHLHQYHTEVITVLDGQGRMFMNGTYFDIKKGDHIVVPPNTPHGVLTTSSKPLQVLSIQTPQFKNKDRIWLEKELPNAAPTATPSATKPKKKRKKKKRENDIPEFEGEFD